MSTNDALIKEIEKFCQSNGMEPTTFGRKAVNDGKLISRLKSGGSVTLRTYQGIRDFMKRHKKRKSCEVA